MSCNLYEQQFFRSAAGNELRPGGLRLTEELANECDLQPGWRVLDVGCGVGATVSFLTRRWGVKAVGLDRSARFIEEARVRDPENIWVQGEARQIPFPDRYFDAVFSECFLSTQEHPLEVLREIRRVLRPDGWLAVTDMYFRRPDEAPSSGCLPSNTCLSGAIGKAMTLALLKQSGLCVLAWRDRSDVLKSFVASMIFSYGSLDSFWNAALGERESLRESVVMASPGYYLLIARARSVVSPEAGRSCV